jgi:hypothetical protein
MSLEKITNYVEDGKNLLLEIDKKRPLLEGFLVSYLAEIQEFENAMYEFYLLKMLENAKWYLLDKIGYIVGEPRNNREDDEYKDAIYTKISINNSGGTPEAIMSAIRQLLKTKSIKYTDLYTASFSLVAQTDMPVPAKFIEQFKKLPIAGVQGHLLTEGDKKSLYVVDLIEESAILQVQTEALDPSEIYEFEIEYEEGLLAVLEVVTDTAIDGKDEDNCLAEIYMNEALLIVDEDYIYDLGDGEALELKITDAEEYYTISDFGAPLAENIVQ